MPHLRVHRWGGKKPKKRKNKSLTEDYEVDSPRVEKDVLRRVGPTTMKDMGWEHLEKRHFKRMKVRFLKEVPKFVDCIVSPIDGDVNIFDNGPHEPGDVAIVSRFSARVLYRAGKILIIRTNKKRRRRR